MVPDEGESTKPSVALPPLLPQQAGSPLPSLLRAPFLAPPPLPASAPQSAARNGIQWVYGLIILVAVLGVFAFLTTVPGVSRSGGGSSPQTAEAAPRNPTPQDFLASMEGSSCHNCNGSGTSPHRGDCRQCSGRGTIATPAGGHLVPCPKCGGIGSAPVVCPVCSGSGKYSHANRYRTDTGGVERFRAKESRGY